MCSRATDVEHACAGSTSRPAHSVRSWGSSQAPIASSSRWLSFCLAYTAAVTGCAHVREPRENVDRDSGGHRYAGDLGDCGSPRSRPTPRTANVSLLVGLSVWPFGSHAGCSGPGSLQAPAGVAPSIRVHVELLAFAVRVGRAPVCRAVAMNGLVQGEILAVRRPHPHGRPVETSMVFERSSRFIVYRVPVLCLPVVACQDGAPSRAICERRKQRLHSPLRATNQEPCVIRDQMQSPPAVQWHPTSRSSRIAVLGF